MKNNNGIYSMLLSSDGNQINFPSGSRLTANKNIKIDNAGNIVVTGQTEN